MKIKIKLERTNSKIPIKASAKAACYDVYASEIMGSDGFSTVKLGFSATPPPGYKIVLVPRSGISKTRWLMSNSPGQGDEDYTGEYIMKFKCIPDNYIESVPYKSHEFGGRSGKSGSLLYKPFPYTVGDRVGQMYLEKVEEFTFEEVEELQTTEIAEGGFGSTGN